MSSVLLSLAAAGVLLFCAVGFAGADSTQSPPTAMTTSISAQDNEAAAKHAKRTACLQEAKSKKLVGARKSAFIKECLAKP